MTSTSVGLYLIGLQLDDDVDTNAVVQLGVATEINFRARDHVKIIQFGRVRCFEGAFLVIVTDPL